jgi:hypothetical protein
MEATTTTTSSVTQPEYPCHSLPAATTLMLMSTATAQYGFLIKPQSFNTALSYHDLLAIMNDKGELLSAVSLHD